MTKRRAFITLAIMLAFCIGISIGERPVKAQSSPQVLQVSGTYGTHSSCTISPGQASLCLASDGLWISINGGAFTQLGSGGVTSVNGKTGAVTINATATAPTVTLQ